MSIQTNTIDQVRRQADLQHEPSEPTTTDDSQHELKQPICYLQPIITNLSQDSTAKTSGRDDNPSSRSRQSAHRRRLPVIVVFHSDDQNELASRPSLSKQFQEDLTKDASQQQTSGGQSDAGQPIEDGAVKQRQTQREQYQNKANSLIHLRLATRTKSIVITFNYRIGLLGYLPFVDLEDQQSAMGPGSNQAASHTRSNHALWDQIGLLHWIKHNVAHFGGDAANVSLVSCDTKAAQMIQLLALSPQAKGLFKRLVLLHEDSDSNNDDEHLHRASTGSDPDEHFARLFGLAQRARLLRKKLISELGLIIDREKLLNNSGMPNDDGQEMENFEVDRRVYKFLKSAQLEQLARAEHELAKVSVAQSQVPKSSSSKQERSSFPTAIFSTRLIDVIREPNLDDKLLFPYFSHLIKMNHSQEFTWLDENQSNKPRRSSVVGFWSWLSTSLDESQQSEPNSTMTLQRVQLEANYCRYMQQLYGQMFANRTDPELDLNAPSFTGELKQLDPYKLIPRVSDHQLMMMTTSMMTNSMATSPTMASATIRKETGSGNSNSKPQSDKELAQQQQIVNQFSKWRQRNRTANALEFYHLRHVHLLQQLLVRTIEQVKQNSGNNQTGLGGATNKVRDSPLSEHGGNALDKDEDDDEDDDDADQLVTRLQRQQQRSIMIMQQQQSGHDSSGFSRNRRNSADGQAAALAQQLVELLASFDLFIGVEGDLLESGGGDLMSAATIDDTDADFSLLGAISQLALQDKAINKPLVSYLQLADLHHLAAIKTSPRHLNSLCEFTPSDQGQSISGPSNWWQQRRFEAPRSSFVLARNRRSRGGSLDEIGQTWPHHNKLNSFLSDDNLLEQIGQFASIGKLTKMLKSSDASKEDSRNVSVPELIRPFDTLNRQLVWSNATTSLNLDGAGETNGQTLLRDLISFHLNLVPYLQRVLRVTSVRHRTNVRTTKHEHEHLLEHPLMPSVDLISCLGELNAILTPKTNQGHRDHLHENSTLIRFHEESPCLINATNKLRLQLRAGATEELEPLIRQYFVINELRQKQQHQQYQSTAATARGGDRVQHDSNKHMQAALASYQKQHGQRVSSMTTRNLVNQSEGLYLDQLSSSSAAAASSEGSVVEQIGHHLERDLTLGPSSNEHNRLDQNQPARTVNSPTGGGIRNFFAKTYKDAVGQALSIVVGTGLLIFLLNLIIVLVIAFRSRRNLRRAAASGHLRQTVQDSSLSTSSTLVNEPIQAGQIEQLAMLNGPNMIGCPASPYGQITHQPNGSSDTRRLQASDQARQSTTSFGNYNQQQQQQQQSTMTRASLSSSSQRVSKSIKFDLSGAPDKNTNGAGSTQGQSQRGIMKQPVATSEEDEQQMTDTLTGGSCAHHSQHNHYQLENETNPYMQTATSPVSLDVLDLIPLDGLAGYDPSELMVSSDDYLSAGQQLMTSSTIGISKCRLNHHHHHHHQHNNQQHQQQQQQSFGGSSLTSPFASQSTHSTTSTSNNGHMQNGGNFSPRRDHRSQPHPTFYVTSIGAMNSPTSSTTLSSAPTPSLLAQTQHIDQSRKPKDNSCTGQPFNGGNTIQTSNQVMGLIYKGDSLISRGQSSAGGVTLSGNLVMLSAQEQTLLEQQHKQWHQNQLES